MSVRAESVSKQFKASKGVVDALRDVSFEAVPGQVHGLLGVNGAGKTTMMRIVCTVLRATSGSVQVDGKDVAIDPEHARRSIGFVSASGSLYARLNPLEVIDLFGELYGVPANERTKRRDELVDRFGINDYANRYCDQLSTGQKQRVSIARALIHNPPNIILDEPTAGLDVVSAQTIMEYVEEARLEGKCVVYSTHIMSEVERLCDVVTVIHEGVVKATGSVPSILETQGEVRLEDAFLRLVGRPRRVITTP